MQKSDRRNIVSVSWSDHLVFGEGDGRLNTTDALRRRMQRWREELGCSIIHWRCTRNRIGGKCYTGRGYRHYYHSKKLNIDWDDLEIVPACARENGFKVFLYVSLFDEGWPLAARKRREKSYHNKMHGQHVSWQSEFSRRNPEYLMVDRSLRRRQWGVLCLAYPQVRNHLIDRYCRLLRAGDFDGLFVCLRSQSKPAASADQFGYNRPVRREYLDRYQVDIWKNDFDRVLWRELLGEYLTRFLIELRTAIRYENVSLGIGIPRGNILGPPLGNTVLQWQQWVREEIIDQLVIDQNSSQCPSMWHRLWPMHRGSGYIQNYLDGQGMNSLEKDLEQVYLPVLEKSPVGLFIARQWHTRSAGEEKTLLEFPGVQGLVFSSFRHDNPGAIERNDWTA
ncbi:MAG: hypothetical protein JRF72_08070 [Deltaproteobacteria bacterium]|jgi:hypothetical protein|nr:hypothetical protein [Deltaproteobacteria bacterium]